MSISYITTSQSTYQSVSLVPTGNYILMSTITVSEPINNNFKTTTTQKFTLNENLSHSIVTSNTQTIDTVALGSLTASISVPNETYYSSYISTNATNTASTVIYRTTTTQNNTSIHFLHVGKNKSSLEHRLMYNRTQTCLSTITRFTESNFSSSTERITAFSNVSTDESKLNFVNSLGTFNNMTAKYTEGYSNSYSQSSVVDYVTEMSTVSETTGNNATLRITVKPVACHYSTKYSSRDRYYYNGTYFTPSVTGEYGYLHGATLNTVISTTIQDSININTNLGYSYILSTYNAGKTAMGLTISASISLKASNMIIENVHLTNYNNISYYQASNTTELVGISSTSYSTSISSTKLNTTLVVTSFRTISAYGILSTKSKSEYGSTSGTEAYDAVYGTKYSWTSTVSRTSIFRTYNTSLYTFGYNQNSLITYGSYNISLSQTNNYSFISTSPSDTMLRLNTLSTDI